jgi:fimbrial isopeptide formation D2 family protein
MKLQLNLKNNLLLVFTVLYSSLIFGQVTGVKYKMNYNVFTNTHDVYLVITEGSATTMIQRTQFNGQITVVTPLGVKSTIKESFNPITVSGFPLIWSSGSRLSNQLSKAEYNSITPTLSPTARYGELKVGDEVKLFSIETDSILCDGQVRLFDNNTDPKPNAPGMNGGDFQNGFTIGNVANVYQGNIESNSKGCPSLTSYFVYNDSNKNGKYDDFDHPLPQAKLELSGLNRTLSSDSKGNIKLVGPEGKYDARLSMPFGEWEQNIVDIKAEILNYTTFDTIGFVSISENQFARTNINNLWLRCNNTSRLFPLVQNESSVNISGKLELVIDKRVSIINIEPKPDNIDNNILTWNVADLRAGHYFKPSIDIEVPGALNNTDSLYFEAYFNHSNLGLLSETKYTDIIRCSYDPNDKRSWPNRPGDDNLTLMDEKILYTIRFQNNGNDTAFTVNIYDVIDRNLDLSTLQLEAASHEASYQIQGDTVVFVFNPIILPDSTTNYLGSQGYVTYSIKIKQGIDVNSKIYNKADIVFDKNPAIITNTTQNTAVLSLPCPLDAIWVEEGELSVNFASDKYQWYECISDQLVATTDLPNWEPTQSGSYYCMIKGDFCTTKTKCLSYIVSNTDNHYNVNTNVFPNPASERITITSNHFITACEIYDVNGRLVYGAQYLDDQYFRNVDVSSINNGQYVVKIHSAKNISVNRLVIKGN